jgi:hypothetical protein
VRLGGELGAQELREALADAGVAQLVDRAHAALAELAVDAVAAHQRAQQRIGLHRSYRYSCPRRRVNDWRASWPSRRRTLAGLW